MLGEKCLLVIFSAKQDAAYVTNAFLFRALVAELLNPLHIEIDNLCKAHFCSFTQPTYIGLMEFGVWMVHLKGLIPHYIELILGLCSYWVLD